jgi:lipopolysaccharide export system protein LptA
MMRAGLLLCLLLLAVAPVAGQESGPEKKGAPGAAATSREPIDITSDRLEADDAAKEIRFLGQVVARQGNVTLYAREMRVFLPPKGQEIERIEAFGDVRIVQGEKVATAEKGVFHNEDGRIVLTGTPKVHQGRDFVTGDEITVYIREEKSVVRSGGDSRVRAIVHPKGETR